MEDEDKRPTLSLDHHAVIDDRERERIGRYLDRVERVLREGLRRRPAKSSKKDQEIQLWLQRQREYQEKQKRLQAEGISQSNVE